MKIVNRLGFQGDVCFRRIDKLPAAVKEATPAGDAIISHSETGHHHSIPAGEAKLFEKLERDPLVCYLAIDGESASVVHHRPEHTHETLCLLKGLWEVRRQREHAPEGFRMVAD